MLIRGGKVFDLERGFVERDVCTDGKLIAQKTGVESARVFKTLVLNDDKNGHLVCVIPVDKELDLKAVARASGHKSVAMLPQKELLPLTGYLRGGCSPIGMKKAFPTLIDESAKGFEKICVSAGQRGCQVELAVGELVAITRATLSELTR